MKLILTQMEVTQIIKKYCNIDNEANFEIEILSNKVAKKELPKITTVVSKDGMVLDIKKDDNDDGIHIFPHGGSREPVNYTTYAEVIEEFLNSDLSEKVCSNEGITLDCLMTRYKKAASLYELNVSVHRKRGNVVLKRIS
jgi:hypothetical protein